MTILQFAPPSAEEWIGRFNPQKRTLTGNSYLVSKRIGDLVAIGFLITVPGVIDNQQ